ncbi:MULTISPECIES: hypothetical protein [unclassified Sinorhizobium]|uniref:hypothetical protein n=1 Tax=unclassified Sinorhizobium TaxID=2613772 RepID=UPI0024C2C8D6|nr:MULTISPECIES: hypothetical protein [unclassified Sinorhizobium]MDK1378269.1 hypothetical protein [Sinorhizobium sp. 6-70]MDK1482382.1 hypothetical protein [Sinorhizobium sp. 6-117]
MHDILTWVNHIALPMPDLEAAAPRYRDSFAVKVSEPQALPEHGVTVASLRLRTRRSNFLSLG